MKKVIAFILLVVTLTLILTSCGNANLGLGNFTYEHAHIGLGTEGYCVNIESWHDNEVGIELHLTSGSSIYCSEGTYILFNDSKHCPFC